MNDRNLFEFNQSSFPSAHQIEGIHLGKPGGKRSIALHLIKPREIGGLWEPYLLTVQNYILSTMPDLSWLESMQPEKENAAIRKLSATPDPSRVGVMLQIKENTAEVQDFIRGLYSLLMWQLLYKQLENPKFKVQCNQRSMIKSLEPATKIFSSTFNLCRQVHPGDYAECYRDHLHWFACCWHEDFSETRTLSDRHPGKRAETQKLRAFSTKLRNAENPCDLESEKHHYRLFKTALQQPIGSKSRQVLTSYVKDLKAFTAQVDNQPHVWRWTNHGPSIIKGQGRPKN